MILSKSMHTLEYVAAFLNPVRIEKQIFLLSLETLNEKSSFIWVNSRFFLCGISYLQHTPSAVCTEMNEI